MQTLTELKEHFAIDGVLDFAEGSGGLLCARIVTKACWATLYLHGAHLTNWEPAGMDPVLFLSKESHFAEAQPIRGGVPVIFPWFGPRTGERGEALQGAAAGPMHGFARLQVWDVAFAAVSGDDLHLTLTLGPSEQSIALGYDNFRVAYELVFGKTLTMRLSVANQGDAPLHFEEALHSYFAVGSAEDVRILGLGGAEYLDKTDGFKRKVQEDKLLQFHGTTDRPYLNTEATVVLKDPRLHRKIAITKMGSKTTVVWNPWVEVAKSLADFGDDEWRTMTCIETANAAENAITLPPQHAHTMEAKIEVFGLEGEL